MKPLFEKRDNPPIIIQTVRNKETEKINRAIGIIEGVACGVDEAAAIALSKAINLLVGVVGGVK